MYVSDSVTRDLMPTKNLRFRTVLVWDAEVKPEHEGFIDYRIKDVYVLKDDSTDRQGKAGVVRADKAP